MSPAEVLEHHRLIEGVHRYRGDAVFWCSCEDRGPCVMGITSNWRVHAGHQLDALKAAGYAVVEVPPGGWVARMVHIDPQEEEGNFLANNGEWYRAVDAARGSDA